MNEYLVRNNVANTKNSSVQDILQFVAQMVAPKQVSIIAFTLKGKTVSLFSSCLDFYVEILLRYGIKQIFLQ